MSTYADLVARIVPNLRAVMQTAGTATPIDEGRIEQCLIEVLGEMVDTADLDALVVFDVPLFVTAPGSRTYPLPLDFGRLLTYQEPRQTGIRCNDGTTEYELFAEPIVADFVQGKSLNNGRPARFILTTGGMTLDPPPDANGSVGSYTIRGTYLLKLDFNTFDYSAEVLFPFPQSLQDATQARYLGQDTTKAKIPLLNGNAREHQQLQWQYHPTRYRTWRRRGRR